MGSQLPPSTNDIEDCFKSRADDGGIKKIIPSSFIDSYTRLEILLGLKLDGHTDTVTEASSLTDELNKGGEIQIEIQYPNALDKFYTK